MAVGLSLRVGVFPIFKKTQPASLTSRGICNAVCRESGQDTRAKWKGGNSSRFFRFLSPLRGLLLFYGVFRGFPSVTPGYSRSPPPGAENHKKFDSLKSFKCEDEGSRKLNTRKPSLSSLSFLFEGKRNLFFVISAFAGMTKGGESRESWAEVREKGATPDRDRKYGPISEFPEVCKRLYSIEFKRMSSPLFTHRFF